MNAAFLELFPEKWTKRAFTPVFAGYGFSERKCDKCRI